MALKDITGSGMDWPATVINVAKHNTGQIGFSTVGTMDAAAEKVAFIGYCSIAGRPTSAKTISSSGGKIHFRTGAVTWASAGTTIRVGIQDVDTGTGPAATPDGTFDVHDDLVQGTETVSANTWTTATMSSGSKSITHGQLIAIVWDMTVRNGSDSVVINGVSIGAARAMPVCRPFTTSWQNATANLPQAVIEFDDGTFGAISGQLIGISTSATETFSDASDPDERGIVFQVPFACKVDGVLAPINSNNSSGDFDVKIYEDPTGTPNALLTQSFIGEQTNAALRTFEAIFSSPLVLKANTSYCVAVKATNGSISLQVITLGDAAYRSLLSGGTTVAKATRNNSSGSFSTTTTELYAIALMISAIDTGPSPIYQLGL